MNARALPGSINRPIIVLGGDGYVGWPLALRLARRNRQQRIIIVDNLLRRKLVAREGSESLLPIGDPSRRLAAARSVYGLQNLEFQDIDVTTSALTELIKECRPIAVYHLAQQCSAPYSMRSAEDALFTVSNNELGNLRLLWAIREYAQDCHIIKLGTFGEYAKSNLDIAEGYFEPIYKGKKPSYPVPYPRQSDDIYHASKINDTNYISIACRIWGLQITDIMQSTIFGTWTADVSEHPALYTRLDYDECFGTVLNRFLVQSICGLPLTVFGSGNQRTGLMSLNDSVTSLAQLWNQLPGVGKHRVINHVTEAHYSINELAETVRSMVSNEGFEVEIQRGIYNPRNENDPMKLQYIIEREYVTRNLAADSLQDVVYQTLKMMLPFRDRAKVHLFSPKIKWKKLNPKKSEARGVVVSFGHKITSLVNKLHSQEEFWKKFRKEHFPYDHINLNPGTLGSPSQDVINAMKEFQSDGILAHPLAQYMRGKQDLEEVHALIRKIWPSTSYSAEVTAGASQVSNLLALAIARKKAKKKRTLNVITTPHEHVGGIGAFETLEEFKVHYLTQAEINDLDGFRRRVELLKPDVAFYSHTAYDTGHIYPVSEWSKIVKDINNNSCVIVDISQSLGVIVPPLAEADVIFGSCHKWLFGPRGSGLLWSTSKFRNQYKAIQYGGEPLTENPETAGFSLAGGVDFSIFSGLKAALRLHSLVGTEIVQKRSVQLVRYLRSHLTNLFERHGIRHTYLCTYDGRLGEAGALTVSFQDYDPYPIYKAIDGRQVHVKCIKDIDKEGRRRNLLRFGIPFYEDKGRLDQALSILDQCITEVGNVAATTSAIQNQ